MTFARPPAADDPQWPRASDWLAGSAGAADLVVAGVPCSVGSISPSQAWRTPSAVRAALARLSPYDPVTGTDLAGLAVRDDGDWPVAELDLDAALAMIGARARDLDRGAVRVFVGGDNAITRPLVTGTLGPDLGRVGIITLDAHHDVRSLDAGPRNGTPIRGLIADGLPGANVVQIGIGAFTNSAIYAGWCRDQGIATVTASEVHAHGIASAVGAALARLAHCEALYADIDLDVLDVAFAPACPGARPGGLSPDQLLAAARLLGAEPRVRAADLTEVDAAADHDGRTVMITAMTLLAFASGVLGRVRPAAPPAPSRG